MEASAAPAASDVPVPESDPWDEADPWGEAAADEHDDFGLHAEGGVSAAASCEQWRPTLSPRPAGNERAPTQAEQIGWWGTADVQPPGLPAGGFGIGCVPQGWPPGYAGPACVPPGWPAAYQGGPGVFGPHGVPPGWPAGAQVPSSVHPGWPAGAQVPSSVPPGWPAGAQVPSSVHPGWPAGAQVPSSVPPGWPAGAQVPSSVPPGWPAAAQVPSSVPPGWPAGAQVPSSVPPGWPCAAQVPSSVPPGWLAGAHVPSGVPPEWLGVPGHSAGGRPGDLGSGQVPVPQVEAQASTGRLQMRTGMVSVSRDGAGEDVGSSSAGTSEIKSLLRRRAREQERPKSSIGSVKIEDFYGDRKKFKAWRRATEAQEHLYRLEQSELAMLLYLSTKGEARDILDQRPLSDYTSPGGLTVMWSLLEETFGESNAESFERAEKELAAYRRLPGQSVASYVAGLKRLRMNYTVEDPDSTWSNKAWAQRLLNRAGLSRRDRLDVFYSAGACYDTESIEKALRHRCAHIHEEERRLPSLSRSGRSSLRSVPSSTASTTSASTSASPARRPFRKHTAHVADQPDEEAEENDDEDLEQEAVDGAMAEPEGEELEDENGGDAELHEGSDEELPDIYEAFQAGWRAKTKVNTKKKTRGFKQPGSTSSPSSTSKSLAAKKRHSTCASCGSVGHWKGDPECPNVRSGRDSLHRPGSAQGANEVNFVNYTFMVGSMVECPGCGDFCAEGAAFCSTCGARLCKREWALVGDQIGGATAGASSTGPAQVAPSIAAAPPRPMRVEVPKTALGKSKDDKKIKLKPLELLGAVDQLTKEEKKAIRTVLRREEEDEAWAVLHGSRPYASEGNGALNFDPPARGRDAPGPARDHDQLPLCPGSRGGAPCNEPLRPPALKDAVGRDKAKAVRQRELEEFRHDLYERQLEGHRCVPGAAAPRPSEQQARCHHRYGDLLWTANQHGHFARCSRCDLKHIIYFSVRHGALMASQIYENEVLEETPAATWAPGLAVADTGCRTAVGGARWHETLQAELRRRGITWQTVEEQETFQFGSGSSTSGRGSWRCWAVAGLCA